MITLEEYQRAKAIVDQYERDECEQAQRQAEWELEDDEPEFNDHSEDDEMDELMEKASLAFSCKCGAYQFNSDRTKVIHIADCICGAD
jgi:hypothetical protein